VVVCVVLACKVLVLWGVIETANSTREGEKMAWTQEQIDNLNRDLPEHGRIEWVPNRGWSSPLWRDLYAQGFRACKSPAGYQTVRDPGGVEMVSELGRVNMLAALARTMR
jgi:hypothetical protein